MAAFLLDPTWSLLCTGVVSDFFELKSFPVFDPPRVLTPVSMLVPPTALPNAASPSLPAPNNADPTVATDPAVSIDPAKPLSTPADPTPVPTKNSGPPDEPKGRPSVASTASPAGAEEASAELTFNLQNTLYVPNGDPKTAPVDPEAPTQPVQGQADESQQQSPSLGAIIFGALGKSAPDLDKTADQVRTLSLPTAGIEKVSLDGGQSMSIDPSGVHFEGKSYSVGGPAMTVSNNVFTIVNTDNSGKSAANESDVPAGGSPLAANTLALTGITDVLEPTGFVLDGQTISSGATAHIIDGTIISLGPSGELAIDSSTILLPTPSSAIYYDSSFTVAGQAFTPNPTAISIDGITVSEGGPVKTLTGAINSLQPSNRFTVDAGTLPPSPYSTSDLTIDGLGVETHSSFAVVDGVTINPGAPGVTINGTIVGLEVGGATLGIGTERFAIPTKVAKASSSLMTYTGG